MLIFTVMNIFSFNPVIMKLAPLYGWIIGIIIVLLVLKILIEVVIPDLVHSWWNKRKFSKGAAWRSDRETIQWLRSMTPTEFEEYIADLFSQLGYHSEAVGRSHDGGIDVIAEKDGVKSYIQCKKYITRIVPVSAIRDFYGAIAGQLTNGQAYFITTNGFTLEARRFAEDKPIELIDQYKLLGYIKMTTKKNTPSF
jgi:restriction system protein